MLVLLLSYQTQKAPSDKMQSLMMRLLLNLRKLKKGNYVLIMGCQKLLYRHIVIERNREGERQRGGGREGGEEGQRG